MIWLCLLLVAVSFLISAPLVWALAGLGRRVGHVDEPGTEAHKAHARAVPSTGGLGIFFAIAAPMFAINVAIWLMPQQAYSGWLEPLAAHVHGLMQHAHLGIAILIAMVVVHITGLIDDRRGLSAWTKLTVQGAVAVVLVIFFDMRIFQSLAAHGGAGMVACIAISIVWLVVITNAMNFLDNMDGLSAGVGVVVAGLYLAATLIAGQWFVAALCALLVGALL
ncbi:MAG: MraY family glycosyltransferase, partial [Phycisphaeraceae bacterium]|nr:MraY family glycosyltransferase [Phycisphaeraceae bacterium]